MSDRPSVSVLFVVGPTACGKSDFAVEAAELIGRVSGQLPEIINCDSVQFFDGVQIGAAKPEPELLARVPHHLVGKVALGETYTAGDFRRDALRIIDQARSRGLTRLIAVGGSGFYVQALQKGMFDVPDVPSEVREGLERERAENGLEPLYEELKRLDPETGAKVKPGDPYRILRALEILRVNPGETLSGIRTRFAERQSKELQSTPFHFANLGLFRPRDILRVRVAERTRRMLKAGLLEEVQGLRAKGLGHWAPMKSVGYKEAQAFLDGKITSDELEQLIVTSTMQLAKRQMTWFKRDPAIRWFDSEQGMAQPLVCARELFERLDSRGLES